MPEKIVMKFGGTSIGNNEMIENVVSIIKERYKEGADIAIVVSAISDTTDKLIEITKLVNQDIKKDISASLHEIKEEHKKISHEVITDKKTLSEVINEIDSKFKELNVALEEAESPNKEFLDYIMSFGERLSAPIISGALKSQGISSQHLTGGEAGIITDKKFGNARPLENCKNLIADTVLPLLDAGIPVITGFIGETKEGDITTLGRGGSDYTASLIGEAINAKEVWIWTDVDGILTCDPKIISDASKLDKISYKEAMELSYFGARVIHPKSIEPAIKENIPVRVKNTRNPKSEGTLRVKEEERIEGIVKSISVEKDVALVNISGLGMLGTPGVASDVFNALAEEDINILMFSSGSCDPTISILVNEKDLKDSVKALESRFGDGTIDNITHNREIAIITIVGSGMAGTPGVAGRVFSAVGESNINIKMISQGSSEFNISFVVNKEDAEGTVKSIHKEFGLGELKKQVK